MSEPTVTQLLLARADDDHVALRFEDDVWTWAEHVKLSADRAAWLQSIRGPGPFNVGVLLDNVPEFSFMLGAAALSGAAIVGLNPTRRGDAFRRDIELTHCQLILTDARRREELEGFDNVWDVESDDYAKALAEFASAPIPTEEEVGADAGDLFMLIFTSGTSGEPKAVRVTQRKIAGPGIIGSKRGLVTRDDTVYLSMPMFHSACMMAGWGPALASGGTMVLKRRFSASQLLPDVRRYGVTVFHYVGKALAYVLATPEQPDDADNPLRLASGNEAADLDIGRFQERFGCPVFDGFGSTEGGVYVSRTPDTPPGSIGKPQPGVDILDADTGEPVPPGRFDENGRLLNPDEAIGELVNTSGGGAFEGYYNDDDANAERMRGGMYWSGDLAYKDENGFYFFAGRSTEWLRVDGENFGAAPVERLIARYAPVSQVAVYGVPAADVGDDLMVTLKLHAGLTFDPADFVAFLQAQPDLGTKWTPRYVRVATTLPETETNKIVKRALAREQWNVDDEVWWREGREPVFAPLDDAGRAAIAERFAANGREHLLTT